MGPRNHRQLAHFPRQHLVPQPKLSAVRVRLASKTASPPHCPGTGTSLPEVENPTGREYNFSRSRTHQGGVARVRFIKLAGNFRQLGNSAVWRHDNRAANSTPRESISPTCPHQRDYSLDHPMRDRHRRVPISQCFRLCILVRTLS